MKKFNWFDILIILVVVLACFVGYGIVADNMADKENGQNPGVTYVVELKKADADYMELIKKGDKIYQMAQGIDMGNVTDVSWKPAVDIVESKETGEYVKTEIPDKYDYYITIAGQPKTYLESFVSIGDQPVRVGELLEFKSTSYVGKGYIVETNIDEKLLMKGE